MAGGLLSVLAQASNQNRSRMHEAIEGFQTQVKQEKLKKHLRNYIQEYGMDISRESIEGFLGKNPDANIRDLGPMFEAIKMQRGAQDVGRRTVGPGASIVDPEADPSTGQLKTVFSAPFKPETPTLSPLGKLRRERELLHPEDISGKAEYGEAIGATGSKKSYTQIEGNAFIKWMENPGSLTEQEQKIINKRLLGSKLTAKETYDRATQRWAAKVDAFETAMGRKAGEDEKRRLFIADPYGILKPDEEEQPIVPEKPQDKYNELPPPNLHKGKTMIDEETGKEYRSNGLQWVEIHKIGQ